MKKFDITENCSCLGAYNVNYFVKDGKVLSSGGGCACNESWEDAVVLDTPGEFEAGAYWDGDFYGNCAKKVKFDGNEMKFVN